MKTHLRYSYLNGINFACFCVASGKSMTEDGRALLQVVTSDGEPSLALTEHMRAALQQPTFRATSLWVEGAPEYGGPPPFPEY
jgi:hypothetical protein